MERRLAAILAADMVGYSRLMAADETGTHAHLKALRKDLIEPLIAQHHGRTVKLMGDGALVEFASVVDAVECAAAIQNGVAERQTDLAQDQRVAFRIGINLGDIIIEDGDIYGGGVNVAARVEALAQPGGICVTRTVYNHVRDKVGFGFEPAGEHKVKNIPEPVVVYRVITDRARATTPPGAAHRRRVLWLAVGAMAVAALSAVTLWLEPWRAGPPLPFEVAVLPVPDRPSLAVLPFDNLSEDPEEEYFADGLTDDLITDLSKISGLFIIARNSVFAYKGSPADVRVVARELGVRYVLEGSVRRLGGRVRINAQLIDGTTGRHVWAERYDRDYADIFSLQDQVIEEIVGALAVRLTDSERTQVTRLPTHSLEAYDYYLRAEQELHSPAGEVGLLRALELYQEATSLDGGFAEAFAGYARAAAYLWVNSHDAFMAGALARERVYEAAGRALTLNPELARAHAVLAEAQLVAGEHDAALASARRAVKFGPNDAEAHATLAWVLAYAGEPAAAVEAVEAALRLDPKPPATVLLTAGLALYLDQQYHRAISALEQARELSPGLNESLEFLAMAYAQAGQLDQARAEAERLRERFPSVNLRYFRILYAHHRRPEDLTLRLDGLRRAGIPEWPFGFEGRPEDRIEGPRLRALSFGRTWEGEVENGERFFLQIGQDGTAVYSSPSSLRTVNFSAPGNTLCYHSNDFMLGRQNCGFLYADAHDGDAMYDYVYVNGFSLMRFAIPQ